MRIGIDISGTDMRLGIVDGGQIFRKFVVPSMADQPKDIIIKHLIEAIKEIINSNIRGIGLGVTGIVKTDKGIVQDAINIPSWKKVPLKDILEKEFNLPVFVNNDSNCFAFGERYYGEGTMFKDIICLTLSIGVGIGIIINNELYIGSNTGAGEIGSLPYLEYDFERYCGQKFFIRNGTTAQESYQMAQNGNKEMIALWKEIGKHIGELIKTILFTYDPQAIIMGGDIVKGYDLFADTMYDSIKKFPFEETVEKVKILLSKKEDITLFGAAALVV
ncbi:ROK family protein [Dysgonomonas sp. BGC7]|uniref:ROK family protein n=1 Tax=Dysgonomonas sp. BGC7 TaxID=1658008 RepID=UPI000681B57F|nr:ROK family protein [Dysgonomonas sp. BGC7]MBD8390283.1 ROK family protein [Dysgonomonas sp. BGC7]